jgi:DNA-binding MarR family transcriptional regulator
MKKTVDQPATARQIMEFIVGAMPPLVHSIASGLREAGYDDTMLVHVRLLWVLSDGPCNLSKLAGKQAVSLPTMSNSISVLVERGWVKRSQSSHDRRMVCLELTPAGRKILAKVLQHAHRHVTGLLAPLSRQDYDILVAGLAVLQQIFVAQPEPDNSVKGAG